MMKVNNHKVIHRLAFRELKTNQKMNFVVILSIILTCILFTALTSIGGSLINGSQREAMRQVGTERMASLKYILPEDYEKITSDSETQDVVYHIIVGWAVNDDFKNISVEIDCAGDENAAEADFNNPTTGRLPQSHDEIAVSTILLDELKLPYELGINIPIVLDVDGNISEHEFKLCGYWQGEKVSMAQVCWVSRDFADEYAPTPTESFYTQEYPEYAGYWMVDFNYVNSWDIVGKTSELMTRLYGDSDIVPDIGINWAYITNTVDGGMIAGGISLILIIFSAGYLIIYNIFHINISTNIRNYGLLKTIGTTSEQIRRMVREQAITYCIIGIPFGLIMGIFLSKLLMSSIMSILNIYSTASYTISTELLALICLISAVFTFATVMISCRKPCKIAGNVSPIEALRYNETDISAKKKDKKTNKITPLSVAQNNMSRNRKKTVVVVLSLTLSMVLVNMLFTVLNGIDEDKFVSNSIVGDIIIRHTDKTDSWDERAKGVTPDMIADFAQINGADIHPVYYEFGTVYPEAEPLERLNRLCQKYQNKKIQDLINAVNEGHYRADVYGIDEATAMYLEPIEGSIDFDKLKTGKYAIVHTYLYEADNDSDVELYHVGDTITVQCGEQEKHNYEIIAVCEIPNPLSTKVYNIIGTQIMIPSEEYMSLTEDSGATCIMINTDDNSEYVKELCQAYCDSDGSPLIYLDKQTYLDEFNDFTSMIKLVGGTLSGILALIGILNFVNAVVTSIISRKREFAMMNAVGMTGSQLKSMLMWEGIHYAMLTAICSLIISTLFSYFVVNAVAGDIFFFSYHFTLLPILICVPILLLLSAVIPSVSYQIICKDSIVNRLREN